MKNAASNANMNKQQPQQPHKSRLMPSSAALDDVITIDSTSRSCSPPPSLDSELSNEFRSDAANNKKQTNTVTEPSLLKRSLEFNLAAHLAAKGTSLIHLFFNFYY